MLGGWGLTEPKVGSDASNLQSSVIKENDTYKINGVKRWIGNGNKELLISWVRNTQNKKV
jgi:alkylation response protein AidB-like acyl-CoA dehydrogenase